MPPEDFAARDEDERIRRVETLELDLLSLERELLWGPDRYGRPAAPRPLAAVAVGTGGEATPPAEIEAERVRLAASGIEARVSFWPSFVVETERLLSPPNPPELEILAADPASTLLSLRPEAWWEPGEWADLVAGRLGPCAFGLAEGRVAALCHTPVASVRAAEAGVWTHPDARRRGYGAAVTAAWARRAAPEFEVLFYSTTGENGASRGIARRLGLRALGGIWQLRRAG